MARETGENNNYTAFSTQGQSLYRGQNEVKDKIRRAPIASELDIIQEVSPTLLGIQNGEKKDLGVMANRAGAVKNNNNIRRVE